MKRWQRTLVVGAVLLAVLVIAGSALALAAPRALVGPQAVAAYDLTWDVVAAGGAAMSSPSYTMLSTAGQPAIGQSQSGGYTLLHGYWAGIRDLFGELLLPVVLRP